EPKVMSVTLTLRRASIELAAEERESQEIKYLRKVRVQPKLDPSGKSKSPTVVETSKRIVERPRRWTLKRSIPRKSARDEEALLMLHEQISACRKRNPRLYLTVAADPDQAWRHIARLLAVASVVHQGASFKTLHALLNAPPIGGRNAYVPVTLSLAE
ncbi:MAG: hypothetical protein KC609_07630, partial [Myxococcales bacterium]|nr:hypothetical protein [Myxococcales bacterium]